MYDQKSYMSVNVILKCFRLDLRQLRHSDHWVGGLEQLPPLCLVVVGACVCLRVPVLGAEGHLAPTAVAVCDVDLLSAVRLSTSWFRSFLPLWSA